MTTLRHNVVRALGMLLTTAALITTTITLPGVASAAAASANKPPIKIGTTYWNLPAEGFNDFFPGIQAAVRAINKSGGIDGRKVQWISCAALSADDFEACARTMISDGVVATFDDSAIIDELPYEQILAQAGIPQIDPFIFAPQSFNLPNIYLLWGGAPVDYSTIPAFMKLEKLKTFNWVYGISASATENLSYVLKAAKYYGIQEQGSGEGVPITEADFQPFVADAAAANADVVIISDSGPASALFLQAAQQLGKHINVAFGAETLTASELKQFGQSGGLLDHSLFVDIAPPPSAANQFPGLKLYERQITAEYKAGDALAGPSQVTGLALHGWLAVQAFAKVASTTKTVTASTVKHALNTVKNVNIYGILPPWTPSRQGPPGLRRASNPYEYLIVVKNGQLVLFQKKPIDALLPFK